MNYKEAKKEIKGSVDNALDNVTDSCAQDVVEFLLNEYYDRRSDFPVFEVLVDLITTKDSKKLKALNNAMGSIDQYLKERMSVTREELSHE